MKKAIAFLVFCSLFAFVACGGGGNGSGNGSGGGTTDNTSQNSSADNGMENGNGLKTVDAAGDNWATVKGTVSLGDSLPRPATVNRDSKCGIKKGDEIQRVQVNGDGKMVTNAVVGLEGVQTAIKGELPPKEVTIDQDGCLFKPAKTYLLQNKGTVVLKNSDPELHNFRYQGSSAMGVRGNKNQSPGDDPLNIELGPPEWVTFTCNIHPWMKGLVRTSNHHAFQITSNGTFSFQVPPGDYTLVINHVSMKSPKEMEISAGEGETVEKDITIDNFE